ncbi:MAG: BatD family protein [Bradymonadales bacterium]
MLRSWTKIWLFFIVLLLPNFAFSQSIQFKTDVTSIYTGMPFTLTLLLTDFQETPEPVISDFAIENASVRFIGMTPQISRFTSIINGRRTERNTVRFAYNYQVMANVAGDYTIPVITATQGQTTASTQLATFTVNDVPLSKDMRLELELPDREVWVGESFEVTLSWYLRQNVVKQVFSLPILEMSDVFEYSEVQPEGNEQLLNTQIAQRDVQLPYKSDNIVLRGVEYRRFRFRLRLTPLKAGVFEIAPSQVWANLQEGMHDDFWGFGRGNSKLYRAEDRARNYTVKALPASQRPASFSNAIGEGYQISVAADRTVVKVGDPINLSIDITSTRSMDGLVLPALDVASGMSEQLFSLPNDQAIGELIVQGGGKYTKRFSIPVRIKSDRVREIPPIAFSFFNPTTGKYETVRSQPIALSVSDVERIGAQDVVSARPLDDSPAKVELAQGGSVMSQPSPLRNQANLDLGLSPREQTLSAEPVTSYRGILLITIYGFPFALLGLLTLVQKRRRQSEETSALRDAAKALKLAISKAETMNAREASTALHNAANSFILACGGKTTALQSVLQRIEVYAYDPKSASEKLPNALLAELKNEIQRKTPEIYKRYIASLTIVLACIFTLVPSTDAFAQEHDFASLDEAREIYSQALAQDNRTHRVAQFKKAAIIFKTLAEKHPNSAAIHRDWGNAALLAQDLGQATLAYRRALAIAPQDAQALKNLRYIREQLGENSRVQGDIATFSTVFFLNDSLTESMRLLIAALLFALGVILVLPWSQSRSTTRGLRFLSTIPFLLWLWLLASVYLARNINDADAIITQECSLKLADSLGAADALAQPLLQGREVKIEEQRGDWLKITMMDGRSGWVQKHVVEKVLPNE